MSHKLVSLYIGEGEYYTRTDADNVLAEKDAEIAQLQAMPEERNKQVGKLNAKLDSTTQQFSKHVVDANNRYRRLMRALWYMRGCFCGRSSEYFSGMASRCKIGQEDFYKEVSERARRYFKASNKCCAMVKEFK